MTFRLCKLKPLLFSITVLILAGTVTVAAGNFFVGADAPSEGYLLGDADCDGQVTLIDATCIQRSLAGLSVSGEFSVTAADADGNGEIEITDATFIQRWLTHMETPYPIGEPINTPTEAPTQRPTDEDGWGYEIFRP